MKDTEHCLIPCFMEEKSQLREINRTSHNAQKLNLKIGRVNQFTFG